MQLKKLDIVHYRYRDRIESGSKLPEPGAEARPDKDTVYLISYTSGTTSNPKGAMLTHRNILVGNANSDFFGYSYRTDDLYLSYVPMSHVFEQIMLNLAIVFGYKVGFTRTPTSQ